MEPQQKCPECGASWLDGATCQDYFNQMLYWENENPDNWAVHHLTVLCFYMQHPSLYSQDGLNNAKQLLLDFVVRNVSPQQVRRNNRDKVDSSKRNWKIKATPDSHGEYEYPVQWTMTAATVVNGGAEHYCDSVRAWAQALYQDLTISGNISLSEVGSTRG